MHGPHPGNRHTPADAAIEFSVVSRHYGSVRAVDAVSLLIDRGEFFSMLGPSGSGKTTCLRLIAGFEQPDGGIVRLNGKEVNRVPPYERDVNTVFQDYALFPHISVIENVEYGLRAKGIAGNEARQRAGVGRHSFPADSASVSLWRAPSSIAPRYCCSMSHWDRSTCACANKCRPNCASCTANSALPLFMSRMTRKKQCTCGIG